MERFGGLRLLELPAAAREVGCDAYALLHSGQPRGVGSFPDVEQGLDWRSCRIIRAYCSRTDYPHADGSGVVCVGLGILEWVDYSHTDAASPRIPFMPHDGAFDYLPYQKIR